MKIAILHPDLGIGGAERFIVDLAISLQSQQHLVEIYASHCDRGHCFEEVASGKLTTFVYGDFLPQTIWKRFWILCANLRQFYLVTRNLHKWRQYDCIIVDQLSTCIPILRLFSSVLFYCHFPDQLLVHRKESTLQKLYRKPFDYLEFVTTEAADKIAVNSKFTAQIYKTLFKNSKKPISVVYPFVQVKKAKPNMELNAIFAGKRLVVSINRFERKKSIDIGITAFSNIQGTREFTSFILVIAGGFDERSEENKLTLDELTSLCTQLGLDYQVCKNSRLSSVKHCSVLFLLSISTQLREYLYHRSDLVVYTPRDEHFGLVPLEAMSFGTPVLAQNNGGPMETIQHLETGWLVDPQDLTVWSNIFVECLNHCGKTIMSQKCIERVKTHFSNKQFIQKIEDLLAEMKQKPRKRQLQSLTGFFFLFVIAAIFTLLESRD